MSYRHTLIPSAMKTTGKNTRNFPKDQSWKQSDPLEIVVNDEVVVVEPTDPDEDRLKEKLQQQESMCCADLTSITTKSTPPVSVSVSAEQTRAAVPSSTVTPPIGGIQSIPATGHHSTSTVSFVLNVPCLSTGGVRNILFQIPASHGANTTSANTDGSVPHPLISSILNNPAVMNIIRRLVGSISTPAHTQPTHGSSANVASTGTNPVSSINGCTARNDSIASNTYVAPRPVDAVHSPAPVDRAIAHPKESLKDGKKPSRRRKPQCGPRQKRYKCPMPNCCLAFHSRFGQIEHIRTHTGECPFACTIPGCRSTFKRFAALKRHTKLHSACQLSTEAVTDTKPSNGEPVMDPSATKATQECIYPSDDVDATKTDQSRVQSNGSNTSASTSNHSQRDESNIDSQDSEENNNNPTYAKPGAYGCYPCTYANCDRVYSHMGQLRDHLRIHTGEWPYMCLEPGCGALFSRLSSAHRHANIHIINRGCLIRPNPIVLVADKSQDQADSDSSTTVPSTMWTAPTLCSPPKEIVPNIEKLICRDSVEQSAHEQLLKSIEKIPKSPPPTYAPKPLGVAARNPPTLLIPSAPRPFVCPLKHCGKSFSKRYQFRDHIWGHTGKRPFVCAKCGISFGRRYDLRRHEKIHLRSAVANHVSPPNSAKPPSRDSRVAGFC